MATSVLITSGETRNHCSLSIVNPPTGSVNFISGTLACILMERPSAKVKVIVPFTKEMAIISEASFPFCPVAETPVSILSIFQFPFSPTAISGATPLSPFADFPVSKPSIHQLPFSPISMKDDVLRTESSEPSLILII